jgi:small-conductance mechanosensitive channel
MIMREIEISKIKPTNLAFIVSAFYFFIGVLTAIFSTALSNDMPPYRPLGSIIVSTLVTIIIFPIIGWICGFLFATVYNLIVKWLGGLRVTVKEDADNL